METENNQNFINWFLHWFQLKWKKRQKKERLRILIWHTTVRPQPDSIVSAFPGVFCDGKAIGWTVSVKTIDLAVSNKEISFQDLFCLYNLCGVILSNSTSTPPDVRRRAPTTAYTYFGFDSRSWVQCAAVKINRLLKIEPPQKCCLVSLSRSETWYGNCPSSASSPPTMRGYRWKSFEKTKSSSSITPADTHKAHSAKKIKLIVFIVKPFNLRMNHLMKSLCLLWYPNYATSLCNQSIDLIMDHWVANKFYHSSSYNWLTRRSTKKHYHMVQFGWKSFLGVVYFNLINSFLSIKSAIANGTSIRFVFSCSNQSIKNLDIISSFFASNLPKAL